MARNVEIKARIHSAESIVQKVMEIADEGPIEIVQDDTFFSCRNGRLKLRVLSSTRGELIFYHRPDQAGPKESFYIISPTSSPQIIRELLSHAYGQTGRVRKHRTLFLLGGRTRIHIDRVEKLGQFLELEVQLSDDETPETGVAIAQDLMQKLGISSSQLIEGAYVDLINQSGSQGQAAECHCVS